MKENKHSQILQYDGPVGPRISNRFLIHLDRLYLERGADMLKVMHLAELPYETLLANGLMISFEKHMRMLELSEQELRLKPLGLILATRQFVAHLTPLFEVLMSQETVQEAIVCLCENLEIVVEGLHATLRTDGDFAYVEMLTDHAFLYESSIFHDHGAGLLAQYLRWIVGKNFRMKSVSIPHSEPRDLVRFRSFFGCPTSFGDSHIAVCFDKNLLVRPMLGTIGDLTREYNEILQWDRSTSLLPQVRNSIRHDLAAGSWQVDVVCKAMRLSKRTLQRRLMLKGTSFHRQLDSVRAGLARRMIYQLHLSLADIAMELGYTDQASFTRAFKRWYGETPSNWRAVIQSQTEL